MNLNGQYKSVVSHEGRIDMNDLLLPLVVLAILYVLNAWVLPRFGVKT